MEGARDDKARRENLSVLYQRSYRMFASLALARGDGRYARLMRQLRPRRLTDAGSSVFPTSGHANPKLMIVTLAIRLADGLKGKL